MKSSTWYQLTFAEVAEQLHREIAHDDFTLPVADWLNGEGANQRPGAAATSQ